MRFGPLLTIAGSALLCGVLSFSVTALAQQQPPSSGMGGPPPISAEKMEAVKACAAAKGVELPAPPAQGERPSGPRPRLTDAQKAILDACFEANGVKPPKGPPPHGKGKDMRDEPPANE